MSTAALRAEVRTLAPEFTSTPDATIDAAARWGEQIVGATAYGDSYLTGLALATAHALSQALAASGGSTGATPGSMPAGPMTSVQTMRLSQSFGSAAGAGAYTPKSGGDAALMQTSYGRLLIQLRDSLPASGPMAF